MNIKKIASIVILASVMFTAKNLFCAAASEYEMPLFVKKYDGTVYKINMSPDETVHSMKIMIQNKYGIPVDDQRLIYSGRVLDNKEIIKDLDLAIGTTIHLVIRGLQAAAPIPSTSDITKGQAAAPLSEDEEDEAVAINTLAQKIAQENKPVIIVLGGIGEEETDREEHIKKFKKAEAEKGAIVATFDMVDPTIPVLNHFKGNLNNLDNLEALEPLKNKIVMFIFDCSVLGHLHGWESGPQYLEKIYDLLAPKGKFVMYTDSPGHSLYNKKQRRHTKFGNYPGDESALEDRLAYNTEALHAIGFPQVNIDNNGKNYPMPHRGCTSSSWIEAIK